jgi:hypothetical protein
MLYKNKQQPPPTDADNLNVQFINNITTGLLRQVSDVDELGWVLLEIQKKIKCPRVGNFNSIPLGSG